MPTDDDLIDAAPCPKCKAPIQVAAADVGFLIECPSCATQFRAKRAAAPEPPPDAKNADEPKRGRNWDGDREPEADGRRPRRREDDDGDEYRDRRRRPRPRRDRDDDFDDEPPRRPGHAAGTAVAVMNFIYAALSLLASLCGGFVSYGMTLDSRRGNDMNAPFGSYTTAALVFLGFGVCNLIAVGVMIPAGIGLLQRRPYGRTLGFLAAGLGLVNVLMLFVILLGFLTADRGQPEAAAFMLLLPVLIWLAYAITCLILLGKVRPQPR